jgi:hypothetical protein
MSAPAIFAFAVRHRLADYGTIINAASRGAALYEYLLHVRDCWPDVKYTDLRARKIGPSHTSEQFKLNAAYRGMPDLRCGQRVLVNGCEGVVVGHNGSANFDVLFDPESKFKGARLNVHPSDCKLLEHP